MHYASSVPSNKCHELIDNAVWCALLQALQYLRKVCNHPALVLTDAHPEFDDVMRQLRQSGSSLRDLAHSHKLTALKYVIM